MNTWNILVSLLLYHAKLFSKNFKEDYFSPFNFHPQLFAFTHL